MSLTVSLAVSPTVYRTQALCHAQHLHSRVPRLGSNTSTDRLGRVLPSLSRCGLLRSSS